MTRKHFYTAVLVVTVLTAWLVCAAAATSGTEEKIWSIDNDQ